MTAIAIGFIMLRHTGIFICRSIIVSGKRCYNIAAYVKPGKFWEAEAVEEKTAEETAVEERLRRQKTWMRY